MKIYICAEHIYNKDEIEIEITQMVATVKLNLSSEELFAIAQESHEILMVNVQYAWNIHMMIHFYCYLN